MDSGNKVHAGVNVSRWYSRDHSAAPKYGIIALIKKKYWNPPNLRVIGRLWRLKVVESFFYWKYMFNMSDFQPSNIWWQTSTKLTSHPSGRHCQYNRYPAMWRPPCECDVRWSSEGNFVSERLAKVGIMGCRACPLNEVVAGVMILCKAPWAALKAGKALYKNRYYYYYYLSGMSCFFLIWKHNCTG